MIPGASVAVLDDDKEHLDRLIESLGSLGAAAIPIHFQNGKAKIERPLKSLSLLFVDIHLLPGGFQGPQTYDVVASALEDIIDPSCGPYILISWSTHTNRHEELMAHLADNLNELVPPPAASARLDKNKFIGGGHGDLTEGVVEAVNSVPQAASLLSWHNAAQVAAGEVVNAILRLTDRTHRFSSTNGDALARMLAAVAKEGGGGRAGDDLTAAMNEGLAPILIDRLMHGTAENRVDMELAWKQAIGDVRAADPPSDDECALLNTMTAISIHDIQNVAGGSRGAVSSLPAYLLEDKEFKSAFGCLPNEALDKFVELKSEDRRVSGKLTRPQKSELRKALTDRFRLVGLSAACDHAWGKVPILKMLLAVEFPSIHTGNFEVAEHDAIYCTPDFNFPEHDDRGCLVFNWRYYWSVPQADIGAQVAYRLREPLMSHLTTNYHVHGFRLGIPNFRSA